MTHPTLRAAAACAALSLCLFTAPAMAHDVLPDAPPPGAVAGPPPLRADGHAPIGVMGDHRHKTGEVMLSYRYMYMDMRGNRIGDDSIDPATIVTTIPNGGGGMPPTLRVAPTDMQMQMHMFGAMYAPSDRITLMAMLPYIDKKMDHITFQGGMGATVLGGFQTATEGWGDVKLSALIGLAARGNHKWHLNFGVSLPTGSTTERGTVLTPMNTRPEVRLPYAMQIGSGTYDLLPGITYNGRDGNLAWGAQLAGLIRTGRNNGWRLGNEGKLSAWASYQPVPALSLSGRIEAKTAGDITGRDSRISAPVQTADPDNYGGETVMLWAGVNLMGQTGALRGHRLAAEVGVPLYRDLNGPQLETDWIATLGWQYAF
ncbi:transporter [Roseovarius ramblicola]|uniref:Transporter n=1 Tax=Roseovarius ramblicola TaxID=2022336 RepID=A0ABV5HW97_9RHOB